MMNNDVQTMQIILGMANNLKENNAIITTCMIIDNLAVRMGVPVKYIAEVVVNAIEHVSETEGEPTEVFGCEVKGVRIVERA